MKNFRSGNVPGAAISTAVTAAATANIVTNGLALIPERFESLRIAGIHNGRAVAYPEFRLYQDEVRSLMDFIVATRREGLIKASYCCEGFM